MAAKLGFDAITYVLKKVLTKKGVKGIATIPGPAYKMRMGQLVDEMAKKMRALGYDINKVTEKDVQGLLDSAEAMAKQKERDSLAKIKIKMEEAQKVKDQSKVIKGDFSPGERWWEARPPKEGGITTVHHLRDPLKKYRDRIEPGSLLEDQAKTDPYAAKTHIVWSDFTDAHIKSISKDTKINYKQMEDILETRLKGDETWDDLKTIRDKNFLYLSQKIWHPAASRVWDLQVVQD